MYIEREPNSLKQSSEFGQLENIIPLAGKNEPYII